MVCGQFKHFIFVKHKTKNALLWSTPGCTVDVDTELYWMVGNQPILTNEHCSHSDSTASTYQLVENGICIVDVIYITVYPCLQAIAFLYISYILVMPWIRWTFVILMFLTSWQLTYFITNNYIFCIHVLCFRK